MLSPSHHQTATHKHNLSLPDAWSNTHQPSWASNTPMYQVYQNPKHQKHPYQLQTEILKLSSTHSFLLHSTNPPIHLVTTHQSSPSRVLHPLTMIQQVSFLSDSQSIPKIVDFHQFSHKFFYALQNLWFPFSPVIVQQIESSTRSNPHTLPDSHPSHL